MCWCLMKKHVSGDCSDQNDETAWTPVSAESLTGCRFITAAPNSTFKFKIKSVFFITYGKVFRAAAQKVIFYCCEQTLSSKWWRSLEAVLWHHSSPWWPTDDNGQSGRRDNETCKAAVHQRNTVCNIQISCNVENMFTSYFRYILAPEAPQVDEEKRN